MIERLLFTADLGSEHFEFEFEFEGDTLYSLSAFVLERLITLAELRIESAGHTELLVAALRKHGLTEEADSISHSLRQASAFALGKVRVFYFDDTGEAIEVFKLSDPLSEVLLPVFVASVVDAFPLAPEAAAIVERQAVRFREGVEELIGELDDPAPKSPSENAVPLDDEDGIDLPE